MRFTASAFRKLPSIYVFSYFPFGFEGRMWDLIVSVPDRCLSFYFQYWVEWGILVLAGLLGGAIWKGAQAVSKSLGSQAPIALPHSLNPTHCP